MAIQKIEPEERNAILAGLRLLQLYNDGRFSAPGIEEIITNDETEEALGNDAIDDLCERVNCDELSFGEAA